MSTIPRPPSLIPPHYCKTVGQTASSATLSRALEPDLISVDDSSITSIKLLSKLGSKVPAIPFDSLPPAKPPPLSLLSHPPLCNSSNTSSDENILGDDDESAPDDNWTIDEATDPYLHSTDYDIHSINICSFDPIELGVPDIDLTPDDCVITETRIYDPSIKTPFDLWLHQSHESPKILSTTHRQLLDDLTSDPTSATNLDTFAGAHLQQLQQFDYDGP